VTDFHEHPQHADPRNESRRAFRVRMGGRDAAEDHRAATPLELLFDLVIVVAIASLVFQLAHGIVEGHLEQVGPFMMVFFAIWWAWMNFTWFASAYDTDDALYRILTVVQMAGVLVIAAGVPAAFDDNNFAGVTIGYLVMRVGLVALWLRASIEHPKGRVTARRYAIGIAVVQAGWLARLLLPEEWLVPAFIVLALADLAVPVWAERTGMTPWHPRHIAERYGLFTIILLGEGILASTNAVQGAVSSGLTPGLVTVGIAGLVLLVGLWWVYFLEPAAEGLQKHREWSFFWGYGHYLLFAALAAVGAALEVAVEAITHHIEIPDVVVGYVIAVPVALALALLWVLHLPFSKKAEIPPWLLLPTAALVLVVPLASELVGVPGVLVAITLLVAALVAGTTIVRQPQETATGRTRNGSRRSGS
jgi:low temperature requirement protein LtrA